jgi:3-oxoacyl-[acyl-carrier protein] reductase
MKDPRHAFDLSGRAAIVTGAASGIGRSTARTLAAAGATVVCADVNGPGAEETAASISAEGGRAIAATVDVSRKSDVERLVTDTVSDLGRLDIMCNNAGIMHDSSVLDTDEADLDRVLAVNLKGVFFGCQAAGRVMAEQGRGSIINMASGAVDTPAPRIVCYAIAKAGVNQLTKTLALELGPKGVRVNAIAPGFVITGMTGRHFMLPDGSVDPERFDAATAPMRRASPLGIVGEPEDIAWAVLYLASDASRFVTGQTLRPNGGVTMPW